ncbi:MAG: hypothetical protein PF517_12195 [Salinivirgaceae bacterium]|jgi:tetratricopeptide (TPR) repeat protein|nr:hypothetical protein [Salinivirgaceae bacterium]
MSKLSEWIQNISNKQFLALAIIVSFLLYGNTLNHEYALDDSIVITKNEFTKQGLKGIPDIVSYDSFTGFFGKEKKLVDGGRYRPLSIITFAIEYQFFNENPFLSHLINLILYALTAFAIFALIKKLFKNILENRELSFLALTVATLFLIHPIHTEVIANIKGRDEILSLLFSLLSFLAMLKYHSSQKFIQLVLAALFMFLGLMSKENTIAFLALIPLGLWFFKNISIKHTIIVTLPLLLATIAFLIIRYQVLGGFQQNVAGELMNNPFLVATSSQKYGTLLYTWLIYFKLLIFPHPLTYDYYPYHIPLINFNTILPIISLLLILFLVVIALFGIKKKSLIGFAIIGFAATFSMVSNLFFSVGTFMNERFVYMPSLFWCIGLAYAGILLYRYRNKAINSCLAILSAYMILFYPLKTIARNKAWKNDLTLFTTDVKTSVNSAKSNCSAGGKLWEEAKITLNTERQKKYYSQSELYLNKSLKIHPDYVDAWLLLGNLLFDAKKDVPNSVNCFIEVLKRQPYNINAWKNADIVLQNSEDRTMQLKYYSKLNEIDSNKYQVNYRLGVLYGRYYGDLPKSIYHFKKALAISPDQVDALKDLGTAYGIMGDAQNAFATCKKALELDKTDAQIYINLGIAASKLGLIEEAKNYFEKAELLKAQK